MKKHWGESIKSFFGNHIDPEKHEQLKGHKAGEFLSIKRFSICLFSGEFEGKRK